MLPVQVKRIPPLEQRCILPNCALCHALGRLAQPAETAVRLHSQQHDRKVPPGSAPPFNIRAVPADRVQRHPHAECLDLYNLHLRFPQNDQLPLDIESFTVQIHCQRQKPHRLRTVPTSAAQPSPTGPQKTLPAPFGGRGRSETSTACLLSSEPRSEGNKVCLIRRGPHSHAKKTQFAPDFLRDPSRNFADKKRCSSRPFACLRG